MTYRPLHIQRLLLLSLGCGLCSLASPAQAKAPAGWDPVGISVALKDPDTAVRATALAKIHEWFTVDPGDAAKELSGGWGQSLLGTQQYAEAASLALQGILAVPRDTPTVEDLLQLRTKALMAAGQSEEALQCAKSFFNVARPQKTPAALLLVAQCLEKAHPGDTGIYERFQDQQKAGADLKAKGVRCALLDAIAIDETPYAEVRTKCEKKELSDNRDILALGNLELITGQALRAQETFHLLDPGNEKLCAESMARAIKAEDGTIARANRYLLEQEDL